MKLREFFIYLQPDERISIVNEYGYIVTPTNYAELKFLDISENLNAEVMQVSYDKYDNSLTITIDVITEEDDD